MIKYTLSLQKLRNALANIWQFQDISIDTKAIVLVLSATMSMRQYATFIDAIGQLDQINAKLKYINAIVAQYGDLYQKYVVCEVLSKLSNQIKSDELQNFIANSSKNMTIPKLDKALVVDEINNNFAQKFFEKNKHNYAYHLKTINDMFIAKRCNFDPLKAYKDVVYNFADILHPAGLNWQNALNCSQNLVQAALAQFVQSDKNALLFKYSQNIQK